MNSELSLKYLCNFYKIVFLKRPWEFWLFFISTFVLSLLPYILVSFNNYDAPEYELRRYYGDGSILTLCSGILCSYYTILFDFKNIKLKDLDGAKNGVVNLVLLIIYALVVFQFFHCQMATDKPTSFILLIIFFSSILLLFTILSTAYWHFSRQIEPIEVHQFIEKGERKKLEKKANSTQRTDDNIRI